jgi:hypothetical protein
VGGLRSRTNPAIVEKLRLKGRPAKAAADEIREKGRALAEARREAKLAGWVVTLYEWHFPWLADLRNDEEERAFLGEESPESPERNEDPASRWLSPEEFAGLSPAERNQRALDRYARSRKDRLAARARLRALRRLSARG